MPPPPNRSSQSKVSRLASASLLFAFSILLICILAAIFFLPLMGYLGIAMLIGAAIFSLMLGAHYLIWGWWIRRILEDDTTTRDHDHDRR